MVSHPFNQLTSFSAADAAGVAAEPPSDVSASVVPGALRLAAAAQHSPYSSGASAPVVSAVSCLVAAVVSPASVGLVCRPCPVPVATCR